ncbi:SDR family NAD(P)-dependent oxidoreductase [Clostridium sp. AM58-1XD]|nr:SDR family NAD(P)-dependent oxidoreductase [Clostridium sp. AM58-1XD]
MSLPELPFSADFTDKVIIVTGAGGVMCSYFSKMLARTGAKIALLDINEQQALSYAEEIVENGCTAKAYRANVLDKRDLEQVHCRILEDFGPCDILINGAGGNHPKGNTEEEYYSAEEDVKTFYDIEQSGFQFVLDLNFIGTLLPTQVFSRDMIEKEGCSIINISSMNAFKPLTKLPAYSAAKAAVTNFTEWLAVYFSKEGIRVNALAPGFFITGQNEKNLLDDSGNYTPRAYKILSNTPLGRFGRIEELGGTLLYLLSPGVSSFVTGAVIPIDGGFNAYSGV